MIPRIRSQSPMVGVSLPACWKTGPGVPPALSGPSFSRFVSESSRMYVPVPAPMERMSSMGTFTYICWKGGSRLMGRMPADDASHGARNHRREEPLISNVRHAAVTEDGLQRVLIPALGQLLLDAKELGSGRLGRVGLDDGGVRPRDLAHQRRHLARDDEGHRASNVPHHLQGDLSRPPLVARGGERIQEDDGQRLNALSQELAHRRLHLVFVD